MNEGEEIIRGYADSERRYILTIVREKIAAMDYDPDSEYYTEFTEGYQAAQRDALAIIDNLIVDL